MEGWSATLRSWILILAALRGCGLWGLRLSFRCSKRKIIYNSPGRGWEGARLEAEKPSDGAVVLENFQVLN